MTIDICMFSSDCSLQCFVFNVPNPFTSNYELSSILLLSVFLGWACSLMGRSLLAFPERSSGWRTDTLLLVPHALRSAVSKLRCYRCHGLRVQLGHMAVGTSCDATVRHRTPRGGQMQEDI